MKKNHWLASSYICLKEREEQCKINLKEKQTKVAFKVSLIWLIIATAFAIVFLATSIGMYLVR